MRKGKTGARESKELRARAEKDLKKQAVKRRGKFSGDPEKVVHELQVHQIELEMQNEELRLAQKELGDSRNKYSDLYDFAPVGYFTFDKNGLIAGANLTGCQMLGVERANLIKKPFRVFVGKESQDDFYLHRQAVSRSNTKQNCEITLVRKDKTTLEVQLESIPAADVKGDLNLCRTAMTDITERKNLEKLKDAIHQQAIEERNRLEAVMEALPTGVAIVDTKGGNIQSNTTFEQVWGWHHPPVQSIKDYAAFKAWWAENGKPVKPGDWASAQALQKGKTVTDQLFEIERFDGSHAFVLNSASPIRDADGKIVGSAVAIHDITELRRAEEALRESHSRLEMSAEAGGIGTWDLDLVNDKLVWDARCKKMFGLAPETKITYEMFLNSMNPDDRKLVEQAVSQCSAKHNEYDIEYRVTLPDGSIHWFYAKGRGIFDNAGKCLRMTGVVLDITERKRAEEHLKEIKAELERSNKELEDFAHITSHDLREPLRAISGFIQLLDQRYKGKWDEKSSEFIKYATNGAKQIEELLNGLLECSRVQTQGQRAMPLSTGVALRAAMKNLQKSIDETGASITFDELPGVNADSAQFTRVFQNLIDNAIKFRNEKKPQIHVGCQKNVNQWQFSVRDNGIGIDPLYHERIFKIFQRLYSREQYPGYGVGLTICQKIVERHSGKIWVESQFGKGSTFYFTIPE